MPRSQIHHQGPGSRIGAIPHQADAARAFGGHPTLIGLRPCAALKGHAQSRLASHGIFAGTNPVSETWRLSAGRLAANKVTYS